jgi:hypothetical protein
VIGALFDHAPGARRAFVKEKRNGSVGKSSYFQGIEINRARSCREIGRCPECWHFALVTLKQAGRGETS